MGKTYEYPNEYLVDAGDWGKADVSAKTHSQARYLAWVNFVDAYGRYGYDHLMNRIEFTLPWFAKHSTVRMTVKSVLNMGVLATQSTKAGWCKWQLKRKWITS